MIEVIILLPSVIINLKTIQMNENSLLTFVIFL